VVCEPLLRSIFGSKWAEVTYIWRYLHSKANKSRRRKRDMDKTCSMHRANERAGIAQSIQRLPTGWKAEESELESR
jgi:hypothetical protein